MSVVGKIKKIGRWTGVALATPIVLVCLLALLLYLPPFQQWAVNKASSYASEQTGMAISVGKVQLAFPLDLKVEDVLVMKDRLDSTRHRMMRDTVADVQSLVCNVRLLPLLKGEVYISRFLLQHVSLHTGNLIPEARVDGRIGQLLLWTDAIVPAREEATLRKVFLKDTRLSIALSDTVPPDTTPSTNRWKLQLGLFRAERCAITLALPDDSTSLLAHLGKADVEQVRVDLGEQNYQVGAVRLLESRLALDNRYIPFVKGFDPNHIALYDLQLHTGAACYGPKEGKLLLQQLAFKERCGLQLTHLKAAVTMDAQQTEITDLQLNTAFSTIKAQASMASDAFTPGGKGKVKGQLHARIDKKDILCLLGTAPMPLPQTTDLSLKAWAQHPTSIDSLIAQAELDVACSPMGGMTTGLGAKARVKAQGSRYEAALTVTDGKGNLRGNAILDSKRMAYSADLRATGLRLGKLLPKYGLGTLTARLQAQGVGTNLLSPATRLKAHTVIENLGYRQHRIDNVTASLVMGKGHVRLDLDSHNKLANGNVLFDGFANGKRVEGTFVCDLAQADIQAMGVLKDPFSVSVCSHLDMACDFKKSLILKGFISDVVIRDRETTYRPEDTTLDLIALTDTTHARIDCGDFHLTADASQSIRTISKQIAQLVDEAKLQLRDNYIDKSRLSACLPQLDIALNSGSKNVFARVLKRGGYAMKHIDMAWQASPMKGLNGYLQIDSAVVDSMRLDTLRLAMHSDSLRTTYTAQVRNSKNHPDYGFNALLQGGIKEHGTYCTASVYDRKDRLGIRIGLSANMEPEGVRVRIFGENPILGYKQFAVNDSNYVFLAQNHRVSADLKLRAADGMGVQIYSDDTNEDVLQDITLSLHQFDLEKVLSVIPYLPQMGGVMNGDFHVVKTNTDLSVSSAVEVKNMVYEHYPMGTIGSEFVYMPQADSAHYVDGMLYHNGNEVATIQGTYQSADEGYLDATLGMNQFPIEWANAFIPDHIVGLRGRGEGTLSVKGSLAQPKMNGELFLDSTYLYSDPYGVTMRFANDPVRIEDSKLHFENFEMYASNGSPLNLYGYLDFSRLNAMNLNLRMRAQNFKLIDAKENPRSEAYGKAFVNFYAMLNGPLESLRMRGRLDVLGNTDMTYVMRDAQLTNDNQLNELVTFVNFYDATEEVVQRPALTGLDMQLSLAIDESAHILCMLNADHSNYIDLMGGGNLLMSYNPIDNLTLTGRYTLSNGEMKYSLPIIPLKTFEIQDGSYLEFRGDPMNPNLHITAVEHVKASVDGASGSGRVVDFDCGVKLSQTLSQLGVEFVIDAPNDMTVSDELKTMTVEGRSKVAITMLASGMYLADGNTGSFSMNNALSSFLQSEINNVAGKAMQSMGLNLSMSVDNAATVSGGMHTDYNFSFSKRLWNNRLSVNIGGKVSTGAEVDVNRNDNNSFFNNVEVQYRLNQKASQYLRLFYDNNKYDWLEGYLGEYGVGFMWKRKLRHFQDIFSSDKLLLAPLRQTPLKKDSVTQTNKIKK